MKKDRPFAPVLEAFPDKPNRHEVPQITHMDGPRGTDTRGTMENLSLRMAVDQGFGYFIRPMHRFFARLFLKPKVELRKVFLLKNNCKAMSCQLMTEALLQLGLELLDGPQGQGIGGIELQGPAKLLQGLVDHPLGCVDMAQIEIRKMAGLVSVRLLGLF